MKLYCNFYFEVRSSCSVLHVGYPKAVANLFHYENYKIRQFWDAFVKLVTFFLIQLFLWLIN